MLIRKASPADAPGIARVHVGSWQSTYKGIMPDEVIASRSYEQREALWSRVLTEQVESTFVYVAEGDGGHIVGFASGGANRTLDLAYDGEIHAIYILKQQQGKGTGRALMSAVACRLLKEGFASVLLWVLSDNHQARRFYESLGGRDVAERQEEWGEAVIDELAYGWDDVRALCKLPPGTRV